MGSYVEPLEAEKVDVAIVGDAKPQTLQLGRADALNARTQQCLEVAGVLDQLLAQGITCNTSSTFASGEGFKTRQSHWWTGLEHTFRRNFLMIGQPAVEAALLTHLAPDNVHYGEAVVSVSEKTSDDGREFVETVTDRGRVVHSKYVLAADGARSTVRNQLGISFTGTKPEMIWAVLDTFLDTDFPVCDEIITFQLDGQSRVSWIPRERGMSRFYVLLPQDEGVAGITQERAEASIVAHLAPHRVAFAKTEWFSTFDVKERIAGTFVSRSGEGRILLGGDAAHVHSVNGGQGLNTGFADAFALSWRLALALRSGPPVASQLIRSYDTERRTVCQGVIDVAAALVRDTVHTAKQYVGTIEKNAGYITGMGVSYDGTGSPIVRESEHDGKHGDGFWRAGRRCPDVLLKPEGEAEAKRMYEMVKYGKFIVLSIGRELDNAAKDFDGLVEYWHVAQEQGAGAGFTSTNGKRFTADFASAEDPFVVVVRPDMYVGFVGATTADEWREYLDRVLGSP